MTAEPGGSVAPVVVAAVQATPVLFDREATVDRVAVLTREAAVNGAGIVVFSEAFVPGYPDWVWRTTPWADHDWYEQFYDQSVAIPGPAVDALGAAARDARVYLAVGVNERDGGTLYNTIVYLGPDGSLVGRHRKLVPTGAERLVWGQGDGSGLSTIATPFGRLGGLTCWENYMPLARAALYAQSVDIYLAPTWDNSDAWIPTLRHIAKEGRVYVVGVTCCIRGSDVPRHLPGAEGLYGGDDDWLSRGNTTICGPDGTVLAGPLEAAEDIVYAEVDAAHARRARRQFDAVGHYARPDLLRLEVGPHGPPPTRSGLTLLSGRSGYRPGDALDDQVGRGGRHDDDAAERSPRSDLDDRRCLG
ncbi:MAG TPA: carbon-nitrogen hydrolase family protein [Acidimicrobiales bacterium]|nr:carbon-nitrogen hydrolase family protein [Acidimicrobiales bacterium]